MENNQMVLEFLNNPYINGMVEKYKENYEVQFVDEHNLRLMIYLNARLELPTIRDDLQSVEKIVKITDMLKSRLRLKPIQINESKDTN